MNRILEETGDSTSRHPLRLSQSRVLRDQPMSLSDQSTPGQSTALYDWDFFLSHSGADLEIARKFKQVLEPPNEVFLDKEDLRDGANWADELSKALKSSFVYVFLLSRDARGSFYVGEEINVAISLMRANQQTRRVIPIYLNEQQVPNPEDAPFGLGSIQGFALPNVSDLSSAQGRLLQVLEYVKPREEKRAELVIAGREVVNKINSGGNGELLAGLNDATKLVRPLLYTLLGLLALVTIAIVACLLLTAPELALKLVVLATLWCLLLLFILWLIRSQLGKTALIAQGQINGG